MSDVFTEEKRSAVMARIRSRGNADTELVIVRVFRELQISGWRRHQKYPGKPDFVFPKRKIAIFVDGCFWHFCPKHGRMPTSNILFWRSKLEGNRARDKKNTQALKKEGWRVLRIWEHDLTKRRRDRLKSRLLRLFSDR